MPARRLPPWLLIAVLWALSLAGTAAVTWRIARPPMPAAPSADELATWDVPRLVDELRKRGMPVVVNMCPADMAAPVGGAVLTDPARISATPPDGAVYVVRDGSGHQAARAPAFRDSAEVGRLGPFRFYGDKAVADKIIARLAGT